MRFRNGAFCSMDIENLCVAFGISMELRGVHIFCKHSRKRFPKTIGVHQIVFFHLLETRKDFFSLKLDYVGEELIRVVLDGQDIPGDVYKQDGIGKAVYR